MEIDLNTFQNPNTKHKSKTRQDSQSNELKTHEDTELQPRFQRHASIFNNMNLFEGVATGALHPEVNF